MFTVAEICDGRNGSRIVSMEENKDNEAVFGFIQ
jgi:hypothetical protein